MTRIRQLSKKNSLYLDKYAFRTAMYYALSYNDWKKQYTALIGQAMKAVDYDDMPHGNGTGDPTSRIALRSSVLSARLDTIETIAVTAGGEWWRHLLYAVTNENITYNYMRSGKIEGLGKIPCGKNQYYQSRRLFYYLLWNKIEESQLIS
jgi:hypothetical protein